MRTLNFNGKISTLEPLTVTVKMRSQLPAIACLVTVDSMQPRTFGTSIRELFVMLRIRSLSIVWALMQTENHLSTGRTFHAGPGWISMVKPKPSRKVKSMLVLNYVAKTR